MPQDKNMPEPGARQGAPGGKRRPRRGRQAVFVLFGTFIYIFFVMGVSLIISAVAILSANDALAFVKPDSEIVVTVPADSDSADVAEILGRAGVINYEALFKLFARFTHKTEGYIPGEYALNSNMDYNSIISTLRRKVVVRDTVMVTIPEGFTVKQIGELLEENKVVGYDEFMETARSGEFDYDFLENVKKDEHRLEGYLFPDTYEFYTNSGAKTVIQKFLQNFNAKFTDNMKRLAEKKERTPREIVIIASLIEKEAKLADERERISGVIRNRLVNSGKYPFLQIDATIQYALGETKAALSTQDLEIKSPYNTYTNKGLPPGPIANAGIESILAALNPESHGYYFYVARPDGSHVFSKTLTEHNQAKAAIEKEAKNP